MITPKIASLIESYHVWSPDVGFQPTFTGFNASILALRPFRNARGPAPQDLG